MISPLRAPNVCIGIQIGVIALIIRAVHRIADHTIIDVWLWVIAIASAACAALDVSFWVTLPAAGLGYAAWHFVATSWLP